MSIGFPTQFLNILISARFFYFIPPLKVEASRNATAHLTYRSKLSIATTKERQHINIRQLANKFMPARECEAFPKLSPWGGWLNEDRGPNVPSGLHILRP